MCSDSKLDISAPLFLSSQPTRSWDTIGSRRRARRKRAEPSRLQAPPPSLGAGPSVVLTPWSFSSRFTRQGLGAPRYALVSSLKLAAPARRTWSFRENTLDLLSGVPGILPNTADTATGVPEPRGAPYLSSKAEGAPRVRTDGAGGGGVESCRVLRGGVGAREEGAPMLLAGGQPT